MRDRENSTQFDLSASFNCKDQRSWELHRPGFESQFCSHCIMLGDVLKFRLASFLLFPRLHSRG